MNNKKSNSMTVKARLLLLAVIAIIITISTALLGIATVNITNNAQDERFDYFAESNFNLLIMLGCFEINVPLNSGNFCVIVLQFNFKKINFGDFKNSL